jgi:hypothetical protein
MLTMAQQQSAAFWVQPSAFIAAAVAVVGWLVAYLFRVREVTQQSRRETYARVLGPAAELLGMLQDAANVRPAMREPAHTGEPAQQDEYAKCLVRLIASVGEVDLIRKSKVSWAAANLRDTLAEYKDFHTRPTRANDEAYVKRAVSAREDFLLVAGRSLEFLLVRWTRDCDETRAKHLKRIVARTEKQKEDYKKQRKQDLGEIDA